jgi:hypothetical protein
VEGDGLIFVDEDVPAGVEDCLGESQSPFIADDACDPGHEDGVIERWEVLHDVHPQDIPEALGETLKPVDGGVGSLLPAVCVAVGNEPRVEDGFHPVAQGVMDDAVPEGSGADLPSLRLVDGEVSVGSGRVGSVDEFSLQLDESVCDVALEPRRRRSPSFALRRAAKGAP